MNLVASAFDASPAGLVADQKNNVSNGMPQANNRICPSITLSGAAVIRIE